MNWNQSEQRLMIYRPTTQDDFSASQCIFRFRAEISISKNKVQFCGFFTKTMIQNITEGTKLNQRLGAITATLLALAGETSFFCDRLAAIPGVTGGQALQPRSSWRSKGWDRSLLSYP